MLNTKLKSEFKFKSYGKCDLLRIRLCDESTCAMKNKVGLRDYVNEIFAGLMWLG